jgi:sugar lactone lactonase YvrE
MTRQWRARPWRAAGIVLASAGVAATAAFADGAVAQTPRPYGDARILAQVPSPPGFPEGIAVRGHVVYVAGPATFGTTRTPPSGVVAFDTDTGKELATYDTDGEDTLAEHASSSIAFDGAGRLYVLNTQLGLYRLDLETDTQEAYGDPFPDIPPCTPVPLASPCSPTVADAPPIPNDLAFDAAGNAYVTDSMQATIWRVPAGGGEPTVWFQDQRLASPYIGVNGLRLDPARTRVFITVTTDLTGRSFVYTLPLVAAPAAADLKVFHEFATGDMPDGIAFGQSGLLYVAMAAPGRSGVSVLSPTGAEVARLGNPDGALIDPYDSPANIAFDGHGSLLLTNHAFATGLVDPTRFSIVDVFVGDKGSPLEKPLLP